jgi:flagellar protein FliJ
VSETQGLQLAIELAGSQRDACQKKLAAQERSFATAWDQYEQLRRYAEDKDAVWMDSASIIFSGEIIRHHFQFMSRLQHAMQMQSKVIQHAQSHVDQAQKMLVSADIRLESLKRVLKSRLQARLVLNNKKEQKMIDEFASQQYARKHREAELRKAS